MPKTIELHAKQAQFLGSESKLSLFNGGVGSGKTQSGAFWMRDRCIAYPRGLHFIGANTYLQLHKSTLVHFFPLLKKYGPSYVFNKMPPRSWGVHTRYEDHKNVITLSNGAQILTYSLDNYDAFRGIELCDFWIDETRDSKEEAFNILLERLRGFDDIYPGIDYRGRITTTPNGFDWLWSKFVSGERLKDSDYVTASSYDNPFLPDDYAESLEKELGAQLAKQQIHAAFINLATGRAFMFDAARNVSDKIEYNKDLPLLYSSDYNVSPLCAVVMQYDRKEKKVFILDEIHIPDNAKTRDAVNEFARRWKDKSKSVEFDGDIAGKHRDTRGTGTDTKIALDTLREHFERVRHVSDGRQRMVFDGIQAVNALLEPSKGPARLLLHPRCEILIRDLEQVAFKPGTREIDKSNKQLTHMSDALRYPIARMFPVINSAVRGLTADQVEGRQQQRKVRIIDQIKKD